MIVHENPIGLNEDVMAKARDGGEQLGDVAKTIGDPKDALVRGEGVAQQEQSVPSSGDLPMTEANCERLIRTTSPKAISNYTKFLGGWCNYLDWCHQFTLIRMSTKNLTLELKESKNKNPNCK